MKRILTFFFLTMTCCILTHSELSLHYAYLGLEVWFQKMIPTLLPFMILSGIMIRMNLTEGFTALVYPVVKPVFKVSKNVCYVMIMGFLCGFPMGAKTISELYSHQKITLREGEFLLAFCNNIGPVYFCGFVLPLLQRKLIVPYLFGMYGIPLLYGVFLRYTFFRDLTMEEGSSHRSKSPVPSLLESLEYSISTALQGILSLGGYMIFFNVLNLIPHILFRRQPTYLASLLEISGGLRMLGDSNPLYVLLLLPFGGISCIAQTFSCIKETPLSIIKYTKHKVLLAFLTAVYYLTWSLMSTHSFLR